MKAIEKLIPNAIKQIHAIAYNYNGKIPKEYNGYIAAFGPSIIQMGVIPAVAAYSNCNTQKGKNTIKICNAIYNLINNDNGSLLNYVLQDNGVVPTYKKREIMNAITALKLAIRTFEFEKSISEEV